MLVSNVIIGRNIRAARVAAKLTQEQMAEKLKLSLLHYGRLERGDRIISIEWLAQIAHVLDVPFFSLFRGCFMDSPQLVIPDDDICPNAERLIRDLYAVVVKDCFCR